MPARTFENLGMHVESGLEQSFYEEIVLTG